MQHVADRVIETTTTTGTGDVTLSGTVTGYRRFQDVFSVGDTVLYTIELGADWEVGVGKLSGATTLQRQVVFASSNANALVNFGAGTKRIWCDAPATMLRQSPPTVRQTVRLAKVDANGYAGFISAGAGLNFSIDAAPTAAVLDFANGIDDYTAVVSADAADQGALAASNINFLYADYVSPRSVTWGNCLVPPQYGYAFDRTEGALLNFEGADASTTMLDDFGNTWTAVGNAQIDTAQFKFGASSLLLDGTGDYIDSTNFTLLGDGSWEASLWFRINALPGAGAFGILWGAGPTANTFGVMLGLENVAGTTTLSFWASSNGSSWDLAVAASGANTVWTLNQWNRARLVFDALAGTYRIYLSLNGAAETQDYSLSTTSRIAGIGRMRLGADMTPSPTAGTYFNGWIDGFRFIRAATKTGTETPAAVAPAITDYAVHFFSIPEMKMYEVTAASAGAETNPTLTQRNRLFVGEADTGAATVSAMRNYALRGKYVSAITSAISAVRYNFAHNLGVRPRHLSAKLVCTSPDSGWVPGDEVDYIPNDHDGTNDHRYALGGDRNNATLAAHGSTMVAVGKTSGIANATAGKWGWRVYFERGW